MFMESPRVTLPCINNIGSTYSSSMKAIFIEPDSEKQYNYSHHRILFRFLPTRKCGKTIEIFQEINFFPMKNVEKNSQNIGSLTWRVSLL